jgi:hypothetical protein
MVVVAVVAVVAIVDAVDTVAQVGTTRLRYIFHATNYMIGYILIYTARSATGINALVAVYVAMATGNARRCMEFVIL